MPLASTVYKSSVRNLQFLLFPHMTTVPKHRELPSKEASLFKSIVKFYEFKQYKKGLKLTEQILKKYPDHGETLSLKGLCLTNLSKKEEGLDYIKRGIKIDLTSHICWHVYGLYYRSEKNYIEAIRCYKNALKYDKENLQILRDLGTLQTQSRQYIGLLETRNEMMRIRPTIRQHWVALALAYDLASRPDAALKILEAFHDSFLEERKMNQMTAYELSELLLYRLSLLEKCKLYERIIEDDIPLLSPFILDSIQLKRILANCHMKLNQYLKAEEFYKQLLFHNPNDIQVIDALISLHNDPDILEYIKSLGKDSSSDVIPRLLLNHIKDEKVFKDSFKDYAFPMIKKGVPSLFHILRDLYDDEIKKDICKQVIIDMLNTMGDNLWIFYFMAQHEYYSKDYENAFEWIEKAINMDETIPDLYIFRARIYKHMNNMELACKSLRKAVELEPSDRYINSKYSKYLFRWRNDDLEQGQKVMSVFLKGTYPQKMQDLIEMQCMWYEYEIGRAYQERRDYLESLRWFGHIDRHFEDFIDDQFDFHSYCLRKMTLNTYNELLKYEDHGLKKNNSIYIKTGHCAMVSWIEYVKTGGQEKVSDDMLERFSIVLVNCHNIPSDYLCTLIEYFIQKSK